MIRAAATNHRYAPTPRATDAAASRRSSPLPLVTSLASRRWISGLGNFTPVGGVPAQGHASGHDRCCATSYGQNQATTASGRAPSYTKVQPLTSG